MDIDIKGKNTMTTAQDSEIKSDVGKNPAEEVKPIEPKKRKPYDGTRKPFITKDDDLATIGHCQSQINRIELRKTVLDGIRKDLEGKFNEESDMAKRYLIIEDDKKIVNEYQWLKEKRTGTMEVQNKLLENQKEMVSSYSFEEVSW